MRRMYYKILPLLIYSISGMLLLLGCKPGPRYDNTYYQPYVKRAPVAVSDSVAPAQEEVSDTLSVSGSAEVEENRGVDLSHHYFIVIAAYTIRDLAYQRKTDLEQKGFKADVFMQNDDGWYRLAVESYNKRLQAEKALVRVQNMGASFQKARIVYKP